MKVIRCSKCGRYQLDTNLYCSDCRADFSFVNSYSVIDNQEKYLDWFKALGEDNFNLTMDGLNRDYHDRISDSVPAKVARKSISLSSPKLLTGIMTIGVTLFFAPIVVVIFYLIFHFLF